MDVGALSNMQIQFAYGTEDATKSMKEMGDLLNTAEFGDYIFGNIMIYFVMMLDEYKLKSALSDTADHVYNARKCYSAIHSIINENC